MKKLIFSILAVLLLAFTASAEAYIFTNDGTYFGRDVRNRGFGYGYGNDYGFNDYGYGYGNSYGLTPIQGSFQSNEAFNSGRSRNLLNERSSTQNDLFNVLAQLSLAQSQQSSSDRASGRDARSFRGTVGQGSKLTGKTIIIDNLSAAGKGNDYVRTFTIENYGDVEGNFNLDNFNDFDRRSSASSRNTAANANFNRNVNSASQEVERKSFADQRTQSLGNGFNIDLRRFI